MPVLDVQEIADVFDAYHRKRKHLMLGLPSWKAGADGIRPMVIPAPGDLPGFETRTLLEQFSSEEFAYAADGHRMAGPLLAAVVESINLVSAGADAILMDRSILDADCVELAPGGDWVVKVEYYYALLKCVKG